MSADILKELNKLEALSRTDGAGSSLKAKKKESLSGSSCIPQVLTTLESSCDAAQSRIMDGIDPKEVIQDLLDVVDKAKSGVDRGLKDWYSAMGKVGKAIEKKFPPQLATLSASYDLPPPSAASDTSHGDTTSLFYTPAAERAMLENIMESMARQGAWDSVEQLQEETGIVYCHARQSKLVEMQEISRDLESGNVDKALRWTSKHHNYLSAPPHPSPLPFYLHRSRYIALLLSQTENPVDTPPAALQYARDHLFPHLPTHSIEIYHLLGALLYRPHQLATSPYTDLLSQSFTAASLVPLFQSEYCRLHGIPREDPLEVVVEIGAGGALSRIEKGRKVVESRMGPVRAWEELPMEIPLPAQRRYHSVFACPVSKEQATESNPPKMLTCGHVIAHDSLLKLSKHGRAVKCPYCPMETPVAAALRLYF